MPRNRRLHRLTQKKFRREQAAVSKAPKNDVNALNMRMKTLANQSERLKAQLAHAEEVKLKLERAVLVAESELLIARCKSKSDVLAEIKKLNENSEADERDSRVDLEAELRELLGI